MEINRESPRDTLTNTELNGFQNANPDEVTAPDAAERMPPERIVQLHYAKVYAYCYRLCGDRNQADDLCQQTFVTALRSLAQLKQPSAAGGWLATTARRLFWHRLKSDSKQQSLDGSFCASESDTPTIDIERCDWVETALRKVSPMARMILVMYYFEEKTYQQIAEELEVPVGTVMSRLARGKALLKTALLDSAEPITASNSSLLHESIR